MPTTEQDLHLLQVQADVKEFYDEEMERSNRIAASEEPTHPRSLRRLPLDENSLEEEAAEREMLLKAHEVRDPTMDRGVEECTQKQSPT